MDATFTLDLFGYPLVLKADYLIRLGVVVLLGGVIGLERELRDKPAGFRTIILIAIGACVFSIVSGAVVGDDVDRSRIAAQIVTGIGFLGAGAIMRERRGVFGLTTAASIWAVAAISMAVGFGYILLAVMGTLTILLVLFVFDKIEKHIGKLRDTQAYHFSRVKTESAVPLMRKLFQNARLRVVACYWYEDGNLVVFDVMARGRQEDHDQLREKLVLSEEYRLRRS